MGSFEYVFANLATVALVTLRGSDVRVTLVRHVALGTDLPGARTAVRSPGIFVGPSFNMGSCADAYSQSERSRT